MKKCPFNGSQCIIVDNFLLGLCYLSNLLLEYLESTLANANTQVLA